MPIGVRCRRRRDPVVAAATAKPWPNGAPTPQQEFARARFGGDPLLSGDIAPGFWAEVTALMKPIKPMKAMKAKK